MSTWNLIHHLINIFSGINALIKKHDRCCLHPLNPDLKKVCLDSG